MFHVTSVFKREMLVLLIKVIKIIIYYHLLSALIFHTLILHDTAYTYHLSSKPNRFNDYVDYVMLRAATRTVNYKDLAVIAKFGFVINAIHSRNTTIADGNGRNRDLNAMNTAKKYLECNNFRGRYTPAAKTFSNIFLLRI